VLKIQFQKRLTMIGSLLLLLIASTAMADGVPLEVYGQLPSVENVALSPDGTRVAYVKSKEGERIVYILSLTELKTVGALKVGRVKLRDIVWADNDHVLFTTSLTTLPAGLIGEKSELFMLSCYEISTEQSYNPIKDSSEEIMNVIRDNSIY
jgi:hypothetical protein